MSTSSLNYETQMEWYCGYHVFVQKGWTVQKPSWRHVAYPNYDVHNNIWNYIFLLGGKIHDWIAKGGNIAPYGVKNKASKEVELSKGNWIWPTRRVGR